MDAAIEAARRAATPGKQCFALGFLTGQEITRLPQAMHLLHLELPNIDVTVSNDYSLDLAQSIERGGPDLAFRREEPDTDLQYLPLRHP